MAETRPATRAPTRAAIRAATRAAALAATRAAREDAKAWLYIGDSEENSSIEETLQEKGSISSFGSGPLPDEDALVEEAASFNVKEEFNRWQEAANQARLLEEAERQFIDEEKLLADLFAADHNNECAMLLKALEEGTRLVESGAVLANATYDQHTSIKISAQRLINALDRRIQSTIERERYEARKAADVACQKVVRIQAQVEAMQKSFEDEIAIAAEREAKTRELLEKEEARTTCRICFIHVRDTLLLPCMHFQYCQSCLFEHRKRKNDCPTCRSPISGLLQCTLGIS